MRVEHLLDLLSLEGYRLARNVKKSHDNKRCPVAVNVADESHYTHLLSSEDGEWRYGKYTPRAYFAVLAWEKAFEIVTKGDPGHYAVEWVDASEGFRTVRYLRKPIGELVEEFRGELKRVIDSGVISVRMGRYDRPAPQGKPDCRVCDYVMENSMLQAADCRPCPEVWDAVAPGDPKAFTWDEVEDCYVDLREIEEAFILGEDMRRCTDLDAEFLKACISCDVDSMNRLLDAGANMYATDEYGDSAATMVIQSSYGEKGVEGALKGVDCLLARGYDLNFCGYGDSTALYQADVEIMEALLARGADPNEPCYVVSDWGDEVTVVWDRIATDKFLDGDSDGVFERLQYALLRHGARPRADLELVAAPKLEDACRYDAPGTVRRMENDVAELNEVDKCLVAAARNLDIWGVQRALKFGARHEVVDAKGRSVVRIALEDAMTILGSRTERRWAPGEYDYAEFVIAWISGFGNPYTPEDKRFVDAFCDKNGFERMRGEIQKCLDLMHARP